MECGGLTGEKGSTSFFFEKVRKWNGLLIEADPSNYKVLKTKHRKAFTVNTCLSPSSTPAIVSLYFKHFTSLDTLQVSNDNVNCPILS